MWYQTGVKLSRGRVLLRAALLWAGGGWALWWAWRAHGRARALPGPEQALQERLALVYGLVGVLAILTGLVAALAARPRPRRHTLHLRGGGRPPSGARRLPGGGEGPGPTGA
jgi:hypothetical protein